MDLQGKDSTRNLRREYCSLSWFNVKCTVSFIVNKKMVRKLNKVYPATVANTYGCSKK